MLVPTSFRTRSPMPSVGIARPAPCPFDMLKALALTLVAALAVMGCQSDGPKPARYAPAKPVDMTGNWEVDYARSDNIQRSFNTIIRQLQQEAERRPGRRTRPDLFRWPHGVWAGPAGPG